MAVACHLKRIEGYQVAHMYDTYHATVSHINAIFSIHFPRATEHRRVAKHKKTERTSERV